MGLIFTTSVPDAEDENAPCKRGRGRAKFLTYEDLASELGITPDSARARGFPSSVSELIKLVVGKWGRRSRRLNRLERAKWLATEGAGSPSDWDHRFPRLDLFHCGAPRCDEILLGAPGMCWSHGLPPLWAFTDGGLFSLRVGPKYVPLHRLIATASRSAVVLFRDGNPWNNRARNLQIVGEPSHATDMIDSKSSSETVLCCDAMPPAVHWDPFARALSCSACGKRYEPVRGGTLNLARLECDAIRRAIAMGHGRVGAAQILGISRHALRRKMLKHGIREQG